MIAARIAAVLGEARREGRGWRCRCASCGGRNLTLKDGAEALLVTCWNGCNRLDVITALRQRGQLAGNADYTPRAISKLPRVGDATRTERALNIWKNAQPGRATADARYLASRGITLDQWPASLRFHPRCPRPRDDVENFATLPAMVALIEHVERGPIGIHCTYLRADGGGKADVEKQKAMFGETGGGAVHFGMPCEEQWFAVAEGIETALSIAVACSMPVWAALSAGGIKKLILPQNATHVVICADHDKNGVGERAALDAAARWQREGRRVRIAVPPEIGTDFNDVLTGNVATEIQEACNVA
jgi:putative DNA primase/helicase